MLIKVRDIGVMATAVELTEERACKVAELIVRVPFPLIPDPAAKTI
jgi:hypothetical protein